MLQRRDSLYWNHPSLRPAGGRRNGLWKDQRSHSRAEPADAENGLEILSDSGIWKAEPKEGQLIDFLKKDGRSNTSSVVKQGTADAKRAALTYRVLQYSTLDDRDDRDGRDGKAASGAGTADGTSEKLKLRKKSVFLK